jgi:hypothetical protein
MTAKIQKALRYERGFVTEIELMNAQAALK